MLKSINKLGFASIYTFCSPSSGGSLSKFSSENQGVNVKSKKRYRNRYRFWIFLFIFLPLNKQSVFLILAGFTTNQNRLTKA